MFYSIIMILISLSYILLYSLNEKYEIQYSSILNQTLTRDLDALNKNPDLNPELQFTFILYNNIKGAISKNFKLDSKDKIESPVLQLIKYEDEVVPEYRFYLNSSVSDFDVNLLYFCGNDSNCSLNKENESNMENDDSLILELETFFPKIEHQNSSGPISNDKKIYITNGYLTNFSRLVSIEYYWKVIKYKEIKGLSKLIDFIFNQRDEFYTGYLESSEINTKDSIIQYYNGSYYKILFHIVIKNEHKSYIEYKRKRIGILDILSTISALFTPVKLGFIFIFRFYSKNFDNYKIIENILKRKNKNLQEIEISSDFDINDSLKDIPKKEKSKFNDINKTTQFIDDNLIKNQMIINDDGEMDNDTDDYIIDSNKQNNNLPKYSFVQFFLNNCYCKCCNKYRQQKLLHLCNQIILKYLSIDSILYYQIKLENLFKDYNWNNSSLNNIENNELIEQIKALI